MSYNVVDGSVVTIDWVNVLYDYSGFGVYGEVGWSYESDCVVEDGVGGYTLQCGCSMVSVNQCCFLLSCQDLKMEAFVCNDLNTCGDYYVVVVE